MRYIKAFPIAAAMALAACGSSNDAAADGEVTSDEVAAAASEMVKPQPGQYSLKVELTEFDVPNMPEQMKGQMRTAMESGFAQTNSYCMTAEQAEKGPRAMAEQMNNAPCTYSRFEVNGGKLDAEGTCKGQDGMEGKIAMQGETTATSSTMTVNMEQGLPGGTKANIGMKMTSERTGECV